jgi:hypothetical protein
MAQGAGLESPRARSGTIEDMRIQLKIFTENKIKMYGLMRGREREGEGEGERERERKRERERERENSFLH